jgi:pyridoxal phosphate enzyme (YggS family)
MIADNIARIKQDIQTAAKKIGRTSPIKLIAVSKRKPVAAIKQALDSGQADFGENYMQEAVEKITTLAEPDAIFHFIGPLQSNKAKLAVHHFDLIHTVDRLKIAKTIAKHAAKIGKIQKILIQVNVGLEEQKSGVLPDQAKELLQAIKPLPSLEICGLMTIPPHGREPQESRSYFAALRKLGLKLQEEGLLATNGQLELSMGMSSDYQIAIAEGATMIRVGTAIFGQRD